MNYVDAAGALPADERVVFTLRKVYGYSATEIAVRLHMDRETCMRLLILSAVHYAHALESQ